MLGTLSESRLRKGRADMKRGLIILTVLTVMLGVFAAGALGQETVNNTAEEVTVEVAPLQVTAQPAQVEGTALAAAQETLPATGIDSAFLAVAAAGLVVLGAISLGVARWARRAEN